LRGLTVISAFIIWITIVLFSFIFSLDYVNRILISYGSIYLAGVLFGEFFVILVIFWEIKKIYLHFNEEKLEESKVSPDESSQIELKELKGKYLNMHKTVVSIDFLSKTFQVGEGEIEVLRDVNLEVDRGELVTVSGVSGAGKTTLLNIISGVVKPTDGIVIVFGCNLDSKDEDFLADFRCNTIGFVFQSYNLVSTLSASENIAFPMEWARKPNDYIETRVHSLLEAVHMEHRCNHFPSQLSGGEKQRVAFARALANDPPLLLVDEPTGNLDAENSSYVIQLLQELKDDRKTVIVATHDERIINLADKRFLLKNGELVNLE